MPSYKTTFGNFLKAEDIGNRRVRVVIDSVAIEEVKNDKGTEDKLVARFARTEKGLVLNRTNADSLCEIAGTDDYDQWPGTPVVLYVDPNVTFGGKKTPGIRIAKVEVHGAAVPPPQQAAPPPAVDEDDIPF